MYDVAFLPSFEKDLIDAENYLFEYSPNAADNLVNALHEQVIALRNHPLMYPIYDRNKRYRIMPLPYRYISFYMVDQNERCIKLYRLLRGMRDIDQILI